MKLNPDWLAKPAVQELLSAAEAQSIPLRFVGGCVRNTLLGRPVTDFDLATPVPPQSVMERFQSQGLRVIPTGIAHGTVTVLVDGIAFEITTLRRDVETDGRHAKVAFTDDWQADASRRDFTMNALYLSTEGELFDYFGGVEDAKAGCVRFIGDPHARIQEDGLRVLRFFRFHAQYGKGGMDEAGLAACGANVSLLESLSGERIQAEMMKLLSAPTPVPTLRAMMQPNIAVHIGLQYDAARLNVITRLVMQGVMLATPLDPVLLVAALLRGKPADAEKLALRWRLSKADKTKLLAWVTPGVFSADDTTWKPALRRLGHALFTGHVLLEGAEKKYGPTAEALKLANDWQLPDFPVTGEDLLALGMSQGKAIGDTLRQLEAKWEASDYRLGKEQLLATLAANSR